jgi:hypothetical protein
MPTRRQRPTSAPLHCAAVLLALVAAVTFGGEGAAAAATLHAPFSIQNPIPPRLQWNANYGYCGETSFISAGLYYGQYLSQYDARAIASNDTPQYEEGSQLLLGVNDRRAAVKMHLTYSEWMPGRGATASSFLTWVKSEVILGYPVIIGVYTNEYRFYRDTNATAGDSKYDHIVMVTGVTSNHPLTLPAVYYANDIITFSDNGTWTGTTHGQPQYIFHYPFGSFQATRQQANSSDGNIYSLPDATRDFGIAITGVSDSDHETVPVRVGTSVNYERPSIRNHSNVQPKPMPLTLTVTMSDLQRGVTYHLYRYDSVADVPNSAFNAKRAAASQTWTFTASSTTRTISQSIVSSDEVIYRAAAAAK